ncbi:MAG: PDZ domain-containing protein [Planctomycetes bacterium]|nr:PDZ domain-containing protein [Planctomycetota bacterium]NBY03436.1 PDZ domain-containing protein [Planctomycetota bacterium]
MVKQILKQLQILGSLAVVGFSAGWAEAQIASAPANFRSAPTASRQAYSYAPPIAPNGFQQGGYKISSITPGFAADRYGFKNGDVIIQVNGKQFRTEDEFNGLLRQSSFGSKITYFEAGSGIVKMREVKHVFARLGISGQIVPLNGPSVMPATLPPGALPPGPIGPPPGAIIPPQPSAGPVLPGI